MPDNHSDVTAASNADPPVQAAPSLNGMAVSGFILGLVSVVSFFTCAVGMGGLTIIISAPCGIIGIILSAQSRKRPGPRGLGTAGLVLSICGLALSLLATVAMIVFLIFALSIQP